MLASSNVGGASSAMSPGVRRWPGAGQQVFLRRRDAVACAEQLNHRAKILAGLIHHDVLPGGHLNGSLRMEAEADVRKAEAEEAAD